MPDRGRLAAAVRKPKQPKRHKAGPSVEEVAAQSVAQSNAHLVDAVVSSQISAEQQSAATMEVLQALMKEDRTVVLDGTQLNDAIEKIGTTIAAEIAKIPAPVVNIPARDPITYRVKPEYDRQGRLSDAMIIPVVED